MDRFSLANRLIPLMNSDTDSREANQKNIIIPRS